MKKRKKYTIQYRDICLVKDIESEATTVRLFNREVWVNLWDGRFALVNNTGITKTESLAILYPKIQTVARKDIIIARKDELADSLRYVCSPYVMGRRRR